MTGSFFGCCSGDQRALIREPSATSILLLLLLLLLLFLLLSTLSGSHFSSCFLS